MRMLVVGGTTGTATIPGISAAGASAPLRAHTPSADFEVVSFGSPIQAPILPVSPSGCPTPAVVTRAVRDLVSFECDCVDAGLATPTASPTIELGPFAESADQSGWTPEPGKDVREAVAVPDAAHYFKAGKRFARGLQDDRLAIGETIPGGTTTALAVLSALGESPTVSSSLPENPLGRKRAVATEALAASDLKPGELAGKPVEAVRLVGDTVLGTIAGMIVGAREAGVEILLAGGTQLAAAGALARHAGVTASLTLATTTFVERDESADIEGLAAALDIDLVVTDPEFERVDHPAMNAYVAGEGKEGVGMGGALAIAAEEDVPMAAVRSQVIARYAAIREGEPAVKP